MTPVAKGLPSAVLHACYNAALNLFWSVLGFLPVGLFSYQFVGRRWLWAFIAASLLVYVLPTCLLGHLQLSSELAAYHRVGVRWVNRFVQDGSLISSMLRRRDPYYGRLPPRAAAVEILRKTYFRERFHWCMLIFFLLTCVYAVAGRFWGWALLITLTNLIYNLYPIWLQQYIRIRLNRSGVMLRQG